jgi:REP element-mobilizing transposase RayT
VLRGNHRRAIFHGSDDFLAFEEILAQALDRYAARLHAYCWMSNHVHMAIQVDAPPLGNVMGVLASRYARRKQRPISTTGHLFERRYRARLVDSDRYLLALVRYIHQNPVRAAIVADAADYRWSSHRAYLGGVRPPWLTTEAALGLLGGDLSDATRCYQRFMSQPTVDRDTTAIQVFGPRDGQVRDPASPPPDRQLRTEPRPPTQSLELIIAEVAAEFRVPPELIASPRRQARLVRARTEIARRALRAGVATLSDVAARLCRAPSTLSELL